MDFDSAWEAAAAGNVGEVRRYLSSATEIDFELRRFDNHLFGSFTILGVAIAHGSNQVVETLLADDRIDPNEAFREYGGSPLPIAIRYKNATAVAMLLSHPRIDPNFLGCYGNTPLGMAAHDGFCEGVELLLAHEKIDPNAPSPCGEYPLCSAAGIWEEDASGSCVLLLLKDERVDFNVRGKDGRSVCEIFISSVIRRVSRDDATPKFLLRRRDILGALEVVKALISRHEQSIAQEKERVAALVSHPRIIQDVAPTLSSFLMPKNMLVSANVIEFFDEDVQWFAYHDKTDYWYCTDADVLSVSENLSEFNSVLDVIEDFCKLYPESADLDFSQLRSKLAMGYLFAEPNVQNDAVDSDDDGYTSDDYGELWSPDGYSSDAY